MNSLEKPSTEKKPNKYAYNELVLDIQEGNSSISDYSSELTPTGSHESNPSKIFGNSARFYKAMKEFQQSSDANILKEELWASRKEIANLEKRLLEKTEEIFDLKKASYETLEMGKNTENLKKQLEKEENARKMLELENSKLRARISSGISNSRSQNSKVFDRVKNLVEFQGKKISFGYEFLLSKTMSRIQDNEKKLNNVFGAVNQMIKKFQSQKTELKLEMDSAAKTNEMGNLKKELVNFKKLYEKKLEESEKKNSILENKLGVLQKAMKVNSEETHSLCVENRLLNDINQELEKENIKILKAFEQQKQKSKLHKSSMKDLKKSIASSDEKLCLSSRSRDKTPIKNKETLYYKELAGSLQSKIYLKNVKIQVLTQELKRSDDKYQKLLNECGQQTEPKSILKKTPREAFHPRRNSIQMHEIYEEKPLERYSLQEKYEKLLQEYSQARETIEKDRRFQPKCLQLEGKIIDLESELVLANGKIDKYKKILTKNSVTYEASPPSKFSSK